MTASSAPSTISPNIPGHRKQITPGFILNEILKYFLLISLSVTFFLPLFWMIGSALKTQEQIFIIPPVWIPNPARWVNFIEAWQVQKFSLFLFNTVFRYCLPVVVGTVISNTLVAYAFGRLKWPGRDILFSICLMTMMIPYQVTMVPMFIIFKHLGWINSYKPLVIPAFFASPYYIFMLRQFLRTIPDELSDAARIDGANELQTLRFIILPLIKPALAVIALFTFMGAWNDYLGPLIYINKSDLYPVSLGLANLAAALNQVGIKGLAYPYMMSVSTLVTLPIILIFFFAQRTFIEGIALTGVKG